MFETLNGPLQVGIRTLHKREFLMEFGVLWPLLHGRLKQLERIFFLVFEKEHHAKAGENIRIAGPLREDGGKPPVALVDEGWRAFTFACKDGSESKIALSQSGV